MGRYKPPASPAEAAERDAARATKLEQLHNTLVKQVGAIRDGENWQRWLDVAARFPSYSLNNLLLIAAQRPDATQVAGFGAWKALGRQVDKGSKGIAILAPMVRRPKQAVGATEGAGAGTSDAAGGAQTAGGGGGGAAVSPRDTEADTSDRPDATRRGVGGFKPVYVFDVSQTSGAPLPQRPGPVLLAGQAPEDLWDALAAQVRDRGFQLNRGGCGGANGLTDYTGRTVTVRADVDDAQAVKTLAHELGHVLLHDPSGLATITTPGRAHTPGRALTPGEPVLTPETVSTSAGQCRGRLEVEAESVAYLVASAHGLDTAAYSFPYVAGWADTVGGVEVDQVVQGTADRVLTAAKVVLTGTEHLLEQDLHVDLAADAARAAERTEALLKDAVSTAESARQLAAHVPTLPASAPAAPTATATLAGGPATGDGVGGPTPERLMEVQALAVGFYAERLHAGGPDARRAVALLAGRGVDRDSAAAARLGYAPRAWTTLVDHLRNAGVDDTELRASGLVLQTSRQTLVDRFRDRVIFPIDTPGGTTVALLGRAVDDSATDRSGAPIPKYLNSPATAIYRKAEHLYGLNPTSTEAIAAGAKPVLVEGPMDVLAVNRAAAAPIGRGPAHVGVAPCGTALTGQQVQLLDTVTGGLAVRGVITAFDGDDAGRQASVRAFALLTAVGAWPTVMDLPAGQDPASLATAHGTRGLNAALHASAGKPLADLVVDERIDRHQLRWAEGQIAAGRDAAKVVAGLPVEHVHRQILRVITRTGLDAQTVGNLVVAAVTAPSRQSGRTDGPTDDRGDSQSDPKAHPTPSLWPPATPAVSTPAKPERPGPVTPAAAVAELEQPRPATSGQTGSLQTAAQRARAGFPVALSASLRPPAPATLGASPPGVPPPPEQHHGRSA